MPAGESYCPDCGAPLTDEAPAAESAVHRELAQANLLRLRALYDEAEKALLGILRRFPNDPHAHEMLGDVCADREEFERAVEWYELALDLSPKSSDIRRKLDESRARLDAKSTADVAEAIGLPTPNPVTVWWPAGIAAALFLLTCIVAFRGQAPASAPMSATVTAPQVFATPPANPEPSPVTPPPSNPAPVAASPSSGMADDERTLLTTLQGLEMGKRVTSLMIDPATSDVAITFAADAMGDPSALAVSIAKEVLSTSQNTLNITLRGVRDGKFVWSGKTTRTTIENEPAFTNVWPEANLSGPTSSVP